MDLRHRGALGAGGGIIDLVHRIGQQRRAIRCELCGCSPATSLTKGVLVPPVAIPLRDILRSLPCYDLPVREALNAAPLREDKKAEAVAAYPAANRTLKGDPVVEPRATLSRRYKSLPGRT
ncbi:hypothetical protein [Microvirga terricola]|uniref:Transposase n=1 Tax=Microvirga terricola TaxID=2719797 RepID=A0ABX0VA78_9HYPH|nr:hypothetical protein [Microvirga terricola]NIX76750.1 hypothetical protein [Microvirga terricola]